MVCGCLDHGFKNAGTFLTHTCSLLNLPTAFVGRIYKNGTFHLQIDYGILEYMLIQDLILELIQTIMLATIIKFPKLNVIYS